MSTSALYTFKCAQMGEHHVYKHWDGAPRSAARFIAEAIPLAWELPRFEADEFAAAFVAANKGTQGGDVRLIRSADDCSVDFRYVITLSRANGPAELWVRAFEVEDESDNDGTPRCSDRQIYFGPLAGLLAWSGERS